MRGFFQPGRSPRIGVGVFVFRYGCFLMGQRRGAHGEGTWSVPGGHQEFGETLEAAAEREVAEETGLRICNVRFGAVTNDIFGSEGRHYVTIWMLSDCFAGEPEVREPDKYHRQGWYTFETLPGPLFLPWTQLMASNFMPEIRVQAEQSKALHP